RLIDAAQLLGIGMDVDEALLRRRNVDEGVAAGRHLAEPRADDDEKVGRLDALSELGIDADPDIAGIARVRVVEAILAAEDTAGREMVRGRESLDLRHRLRVPCAAAEQQERALRR